MWIADAVAAFRTKPCVDTAADLQRAVWENRWGELTDGQCQKYLDEAENYHRSAKT
jgi:hypothetical protein